MWSQAWFCLQNKGCCQCKASRGLLQIDPVDAWRLRPTESLQKPREQHHHEGGAQRHAGAASPPGAEGDEAQVRLGENDDVGGPIAGEMALRPELERFGPHLGVLPQPDPADNDMAVLGDQVPCNGGVLHGDTRRADGMVGVQAEGLPDA